MSYEQFLNSFVLLFYEVVEKREKTKENKVEKGPVKRIPEINWEKRQNCTGQKSGKINRVATSFSVVRLLLQLGRRQNFNFYLIPWEKSHTFKKKSAAQNRFQKLTRFASGFFHCNLVPKLVKKRLFSSPTFGFF